MPTWQQKLKHTNESIQERFYASRSACNKAVHELCVQAVELFLQLDDLETYYKHNKNDHVRDGATIMFGINLENKDFTTSKSDTDLVNGDGTYGLGGYMKDNQYKTHNDTMQHTQTCSAAV